MARTTVKATYSLAPEVVARLERLAAGWKVSKSEALSRAIRSAEEQSSGVSSFDALDALQTGGMCACNWKPGQPTLDGK